VEETDDVELLAPGEGFWEKRRLRKILSSHVLLDQETARPVELMRRVYLILGIILFAELVIWMMIAFGQLDITGYTIGLAILSGFILIICTTLLFYAYQWESPKLLLPGWGAMPVADTRGIVKTFELEVPMRQVGISEGVEMKVQVKEHNPTLKPIDPRDEKELEGDIVYVKMPAKFEVWRFDVQKWPVRLSTKKWGLAITRVAKDKETSGIPYGDDVLVPQILVRMPYAICPPWVRSTIQGAKVRGVAPSTPIYYSIGPHPIGNMIDIYTLPELGLAEEFAIQGVRINNLQGEIVNLTRIFRRKGEQMARAGTVKEVYVESPER